MKNYINNLIKLPVLYFILIRNLKYQRKFIYKTLSIDIEISKKTSDNSLDDQDYKKITDYYGYAVPAILGESFCILRGRKMSLKERTAITYLGALSGLFDDFFDKKDLTESYIKKLIEQPDKQPGNNANERLFINFYKKALEHSADASLVKSYFFNVFDAQILSKEQMCAETDIVEIENITYLKGGISFLFYSSIFGENKNENERMMIYKLGALMQLENDIFDVYKDNQDGIRTLVTIEKSINHLRKNYIALTEEVFNLAQLTNYPAKNIKLFLRFVSMVICRGFVCLDMLENNESLTNKIFSLADYTRKNLICDMEKPINFLKTINYYANNNFEKKI